MKAILILSLTLLTSYAQASDPNHPVLTKQCQKNLICTTMRQLNRGIGDEDQQYRKAPGILVYDASHFQVSLAGDIDVEHCDLTAKLIQNKSGTYDCKNIKVVGQCRGGGNLSSGGENAEPFSCK